MIRTNDVSETQAAGSPTEHRLAWLADTEVKMTKVVIVLVAWFLGVLAWWLLTDDDRKESSRLSRRRPPPDS